MPSFTIPSKFTAVDKVSSPVSKMAQKTSKFANTAKASFARAERSARKFRSTVSNVNSKLFNMRNAAGFLVAGGIAKGVQKIADETATYTDNLAKNARFLDMGISQLQGYHFAAERAGVSTQKMDKAFESVGKRVGELQKDTGSLYNFLEKRGDKALISQLKNAKNTDEAMKLLADKYKSLETQTAKAGFASKAFSKTNMEVAKVMEDGSEGLQEMIDRQQKYGPSVEASSKAAENYKDNQTNMNLALRSAKVMIGTELIPRISSVMEKTSEWIATNKDLIRTKIEEWVERFTKFVEGAVVAGKAMGTTIYTLGSVTWGLVSAVLSVLRPIGQAVGLFSSGDKKAKGWKDKLQLLGTVLGVVTAGIVAMNIAAKVAMVVQGSMRVATAAVTAAQWAWNAAMNANPIGLVITAVAALIGLVTAVTKKWDSWGAAVAVFMGPLGMVISLIKSFQRNWEMIKEAFETKGIVGGLKAIGITILDALLQPVQQLLELVGKLPTWLGGGLAKNAAAGIEKMRKNIRGVGDEIDKMNKKAQEATKDRGQSARKSNPQSAQNQNFQRILQENNENINLNINDPGNRTTVKRDKKKRSRLRLTKTQGAFAL